MEEVEVRLLRDHCKTARDMKDEEINRLDVYLQEASYLRPSNFIRIGNLIELRRLRATHYPAQPEPLDPRTWDVFWLFRCELLLLDGHYGPCCAWARATLDYYLQKRCLREKGDQYARAKEEDRHGWNPSVSKCLEILGYPKGEKVDKICDDIKNAGDYVLHHRLELLVSDQAVDNKYQDSFDEKQIGILKEHKDDLRPTFERDKAIESLEKLYKLCEMKVLF